MGIEVLSPAAFEIVIAVSSATLLGILGTGGNSRNVSLRVLFDLLRGYPDWITKLLPRTRSSK